MNTNKLLTVFALALGLAPLGLPVRAADAMSGMDMGATAAPTKAPASLSVTATVKPNPPRAGDNALDLLVTDAAGKPVAGLKLSASVAMTSMDMGTTRPALADTGNGHYAATVNFSMAGPWRVAVRNGKARVAVLDFEAGGKTPWKSPQAKPMAAPASPEPDRSSKTDGSMAGMDMGGGQGAAKPGGGAQAENMGGMNTPGMSMPGMAGMDMGGGGKSGTMDMQTAQVPKLQEKGTTTVTGQENWKVRTGFGHNSGMVGMMIRMMVGGSGMEGMKMPVMKMDFGKKNYTESEDDTDTNDMAGMDMGGSKSGSMPGMDMSGKTDALSGMGTSTAPPSAPSGGQPSKAPVSKGGASDQAMPGMTMPAPKAGSPAPAPLTVTATTPSPKTGDNPLTITVRDAQGKPVTGAKITASVVMTSMDMGTTHPAVQEVGSGKYTVTAAFSMAGLWRVKVRVAAPGQKPALKAFDFTAK